MPDHVAAEEQQLPRIAIVEGRDIERPVKLLVELVIVRSAVPALLLG
jgi:hypothetical protein